MATYTVNFRQVTDNHMVLQTLEDTDIGIGQSVTVAGLGAVLNGTYTVIDTPVYRFLGVDEEGNHLFDYDDLITNQLLVQKTASDVARSAVNGTLTYTATCTWVNAASVISWLGIAAATANDTAFITSATAAANQFAYRRRKESGYFDSLTTSPGDDVSLGTTMYAASLYRERGAVDSFASFDSMGSPTPFGSMGQIMRLLGVNRSQVA